MSYIFAHSLQLAASHSVLRTRRDTTSLTLEDVRSEIRSQLSSVTAAQLCSSQGKVYLAGPPGIKGEPGFKGQPGIKGLSKTSVLPSQRKSGVKGSCKGGGGGL